MLVELVSTGIREEDLLQSDPRTLMTYVFFLGIIAVNKDQFGLHAFIVDDDKTELLAEMMKTKDELVPRNPHLISIRSIHE